MKLDLIVMNPPAIASDAAQALERTLAIEGISVSLCGQRDDWSERAGLRTVAVENGSPLAAANVAVASSSAEWVTLLDGEYALEEMAARRLLLELDRTELESGVLGRRQRSGLNGIDAEPSAFSTGGITVWRRNLWMRLRGLDEGCAAVVAARDLLLRADRAGVYAMDLGLQQINAVRYVGSHAESDWSKTAEHDMKKLIADLDHDPTIYRNLVAWSVPASLREPLVSVAIATRDRGPLLRDSLNSVMFQTFQDFEVLVVDDGSTDTQAADIVAEFGDPRIKYVRQEPAGIAAARNLAADIATGHFTAVHDDDDIMVPGRLQTSLQAMTAAVDAVYGAWANFDEDTGAMRVFITKREFSAALNAFSGQSPGHGTWLLPTSLVRRFRYDERLTSSVDHNLASRIVWHGYRWAHVGEVLMLRRVHHGQISKMESASQKAGHVLTLFANELNAGPLDAPALRAEGKAIPFPVLAHDKDLVKAFGAYLPDHLVHRTALITRDVTNSLFEMDMPPSIDFMLEERDVVSGRLRGEIAQVSGIRLSDLASFRQRGIVSVELDARLRDPAELKSEAVEGGGDALPPYEEVIARLSTINARRANGHLTWVIVRSGSTAAPPPASHSASYSSRIIASGPAGARIIVYAFGYDSLAAAEGALVQLRRERPDVTVQILSQNRAEDFRFDSEARN